MFKTYDQVDWGLLHFVSLQMDFAKAWVQLVMQYVLTISFSILVNGNPTTPFSPSCGLRQGDPLSLYLCLKFILTYWLLPSQMVASWHQALTFFFGYYQCVVC